MDYIIHTYIQTYNRKALQKSTSVNIRKQLKNVWLQGNYTCSPSNSEPATVHVFIQEGNYWPLLVLMTSRAYVLTQKVLTVERCLNMLNPLTHEEEGALYVPPPVVFCPLLKKSSGLAPLKLKNVQKKLQGRLCVHRGIV